MSSNIPEFGENDLPPPGGLSPDSRQLSNWVSKQFMEAMLKLRTRSRSGNEVLNLVLSREVIVSELRAAKQRFEELLAAVLQGEAPEYLRQELGNNSLSADARLRELIDLWKQENIENLSLVAENVSLAATYQDILEPNQLWDVCLDVRWIESALVEGINSDLR